MTLRVDEFPLGRRDAPHPAAMFGPDSAAWRLRQAGGIVLALAKARAALLQLAHPKIAAGLAEHSTFDADPFGRIQLTGQTMAAIQFGSPEEHDEALRLLGRLHARVRGTMADGASYTAGDPELLWFVLATLVDSDLLVEARYVRAFDERDREAYVAERRALAEAFGIPASLVAHDRAALDAYVAGAVPRLHVTPAARRMGGRILHPTYLRAPRPVQWGAKQLLAELLPVPLRVGFGLPELPSPSSRLVAATASRALPRLPPRLRRRPIEARAQ